MPILEITDGRGNLRPDAGVVITGTAIYPRDEAKRKDWVAAFYSIILADILDQLPDSIPVDDPGCLIEELFELVVALSKLNLSPKQTTQNGLDRLLTGHAVGEILSTRLGTVGTKHATSERAVFLVSELFSDPRNCGGSPVKAGKSTLTKAWAKYQSAAHLHHTLGIIDKVAGKELFFFRGDTSPEVFFMFLEIAESLRIRAEQDGILNEKDTWKAPGDLAIKPIELDGGGLEPESIERLEAHFVKRIRF